MQIEILPRRLLLQLQEIGFKYKPRLQKLNLTVPAKWIRDSYDINISVKHTTTKPSRRYYFDIQYCDNQEWIHAYGRLFKTYELALEAALYEAVKIIKT